jgi:hypothetical protein
MWREVRREALRFGWGVLAGFDSDGGPVSARVGVEVEEPERALAVDDPYPAQVGRASVLFQRHDDRLWKLRSCLIVGTLRHDDGRWLFEPDRFVPGMGIGGPLSYMRLLVKGRKTAARYLAARGMARPEAAWGEILELVRRAEEDRSSEAAVP